MIEQKKKLRLDELHVDSFITNSEQQSKTIVVGGSKGCPSVFCSVGCSQEVGCGWETEQLTCGPDYTCGSNWSIELC